MQKAITMIKLQINIEKKKHLNNNNNKKKQFLEHQFSFKS